MSDIQGALNRLAGITDWREFVGMQEAANRIAGTHGLGTQEALNRAIGITDWRIFVDEYTAARTLIDTGATPPGGGGTGGSTGGATVYDFSTMADGPAPSGLYLAGPNTPVVSGGALVISNSVRNDANPTRVYMLTSGGDFDFDIDFTRTDGIEVDLAVMATEAVPYDTPGVLTAAIDPANTSLRSQGLGWFASAPNAGHQNVRATARYEVRGNTVTCYTNGVKVLDAVAFTRASGANYCGVLDFRVSNFLVHKMSFQNVSA